MAKESPAASVTQNPAPEAPLPCHQEPGNAPRSPWNFILGHLLSLFASLGQNICRESEQALMVAFGLVLRAEICTLQNQH